MSSFRSINWLLEGATPWGRGKLGQTLIQLFSSVQSLQILSCFWFAHQGFYVACVIDGEARRGLANGLGDEARREMSVVPLHHARVAVPKVLRHDHKRHAVHHRMRGPRVPQA